MELRDATLSHAQRNWDRFLDDLKEFLAITSVFTNPSKDEPMRRAAD
jgi:hypothetical protein